MKNVFVVLFTLTIFTNSTFAALNVKEVIGRGFADGNCDFSQDVQERAKDHATRNAENECQSPVEIITDFTIHGGCSVWNYYSADAVAIFRCKSTTEAVGTLERR